MATDVDYDQIVRDSTEQLRAKFPDRSEEELRTVVEEELATLRDATVQDYLSVLTVRAARKRIKAQRKAE
ncbi:three-helix bundle dimerization domain-containing protein [Clavibacter michiganensis]|uniref:three-helix bundle dimerization domain-containing protein n=1 Tax=Clavibacter michiganensis TaxID=28447 RepID=UPI003EC0B3F7